MDVSWCHLRNAHKKFCTLKVTCELSTRNCLWFLGHSYPVLQHGLWRKHRCYIVSLKDVDDTYIKVPLRANLRHKSHMLVYEFHDLFELIPYRLIHFNVGFTVEFLDTCTSTQRGRIGCLLPIKLSASRFYFLSPVLQAHFRWWRSGKAYFYSLLRITIDGSPSLLGEITSW